MTFLGGNSRQRKKRFIRSVGIAAVAGAAALYGAAVVAYLWDSRAVHVTVARIQHGEVQEPEAVDTTLRALQLSGVASGRVEPVSFRHDSTILFARKSDRSSEGYVLWWHPDDNERLWHYMVRCEWEESTADCSITHPH